MPTLASLIVKDWEEGKNLSPPGPPPPSLLPSGNSSMLCSVSMWYRISPPAGVPQASWNVSASPTLLCYSVIVACSGYSSPLHCPWAYSRTTQWPRAAAAELTVAPLPARDRERPDGRRSTSGPSPSCVGCAAPVNSAVAG